jgi:hypothetical protein
MLLRRLLFFVSGELRKATLVGVVTIAMVLSGSDVALSQTPQAHNTLKALSVYTSGPVELILTDPQGRKTGFDPIHKISFQDIPISVYSTTIYSDEQNPSSPPPRPFKAIYMANQMDRQYTLDVIGTGSGDFTVGVRASDAAGNWITQTHSGTAAPGRIFHYTFPGKVNIFGALGARLKITSASKAFEVKGTFTLGPDGTISPVTQPLTIQLGNYFLATIPAGYFRQTGRGTFVFEGSIHGVALDATLAPTGGNLYAFTIKGMAPDLPDANPVDVRLAIGNTGGSVSVTADFVR